MVSSRCGLPLWQQQMVIRRPPVLCSVAAEDLKTQTQQQESARKKVVLIGGSGRLGSSTAKRLVESWPDMKFVLAGRDREKGERVASSIAEGTTFQEVEVEDLDSVAAAIDGADLVIHSAGAFQRRKSCTVLEAAIECKVPYLDACDNLNHAKLAKSLHEKAVEAGVPAIVTAGLYPGVSNIMAAELVRYAAETEESKPEELRYSYFTAGTGGAGSTILATSFALLKEDALTFDKGKICMRKPFSDKKFVDFGIGVGKRFVYLVNLPEVTTSHLILGVPSVTARFGTAPFFWNWTMSALAGQDFLKDWTKLDDYVKFSEPAVRLIDNLVGKTVSMRVDLKCCDGKRSAAVFTHRNLLTSVGRAMAAFVQPILEGKTQPGVWFPEQEEAVPIEERPALLKRASKGNMRYVMNRAFWMVETPPKEVSFGIYLE